jgi:hypothetical protein
VLEPNERIAEVLFGLIMVLTFTGSLSVAEAGRDDVRTMLIGALGCNIAWGLIDAILYLMGSLAEKSKSHATLRAVRNSPTPKVAHQVIADAVPSALARVLDETDLEMLRKKLNQVPEPSSQPHLTSADWKGALAVFLLVFSSTFPVTVPFIFVHSAPLAIRLSNGIAVAMLFFTGFAYGRCVGRSPWLVGLCMVGLGAVLVTITMALGG